MRMTTGGIGIDRVTAGLSTLSIYGNDKFKAWVAGGAVVSKIVSPSGKMQIIMRQDPTGPGKADFGNAAWMRAWGKVMPGEQVPKFGQTAPDNVELLDHGKTIRITMPEPGKRAPLMRGKNKPKKGSPEKEVERQAEPTVPHTDPLAALRKALDEVNSLGKQAGARFTINQGKVMAVVEIGG